MIEGILLVILVACSAFFGASETGYLSLGRVTLRGLKKSSDSAEKRVLKLHKKMDRLLGTILIGTNLVNNLASSIAAGIALAWAEGAGAAVSDGAALAAVTLVMTVVIVMFGDILPKTIAAYNPLPAAKFTSLPLSVLGILFAPFITVFSGLSRALEKIAGRAAGGADAPLVTEEEIATLIELGHREGTVEGHEKDLLKRIIKFQDMKAENIMRHRSLVKGVSRDASYDELIDLFAAVGYSQIPVYDRTTDNYVSLVDYRDLLYGPGPFKMPERPLRFVPGTMSAANVLKTFKREGVHFAVVVDEHGGNLGVITMKDVLHAVLGRIDRNAANVNAGDPSQVHFLAPHVYSVPGAMTLTDCNEIFGLSLDSASFDTIAGWFMERFDALPSPGDSVACGPWEYTVEDMEDRKITRVWLHKS